MWMLHGSCVSERPACSRSAGGLAASAAVPGAAEQVTSLKLNYTQSNYFTQINDNDTPLMISLH